MKNHLTKLMHLLKKGHLLVKKRALHVSKKHLKGHGFIHNMHQLTLGSGTPAHIKQWADISGSGFKKQGNIKGIKPLSFRF